jgi:hexosaminidase
MDEALYLRFVDEVRTIVRSLGKEPIGWQESARGTLQPGDIVQEWIPSELAGMSAEDLDDDARAMVAQMSPEMLEAIQHMLVMAQDDIPRALSQGGDVLLSRANTVYLDGKYGEASLDHAQEDLRARLGISPYGVVSVRDYFAWEPGTLIADLPPDRIVGVEGAIWCETITGRDDLFFQLLPRLPGVLEKGWASAADQSDPATWEAFRAALVQQTAEWDRRGLAWFVATSVWGA